MFQAFDNPGPGGPLGRAQWMQRHFQDGQDVKQGDLLFTLVELGLSLGGVRTALDLEKGVALLGDAGRDAER